MQDFCLEQTKENVCDLKCPKCKQGYNVIWNTEFGDFLAGSHSYECSNCEHKFYFEGEVKYSSWEGEFS